MSRPRAAAPCVPFALALLALPVTGCSLREVAASKIGDSLASGGAGWGSEDDPELVREALPFALKLMEGLAAEAPRNASLRLGLCRGFASYATGFLEADADRVESESFEGARAIRERAAKLDLRARAACLDALELRYPGIRAGVLAGDAAALDRTGTRDVELLYWTGASWGAAISLGLDRPERVAELPAVRALFDRALALDEAYDRGALHEVMIAFDSMPAMMGGSHERARAHYERAVALSSGERASPHVTWARISAVSRQARGEFREALGAALAVDVDAVPADRLANLLAQERARLLLAREDELFFADEPEAEPR